MTIRRSVLVAVFLTAGGCAGWTAPVNKMDSLPREEREAIFELPILQEGDLSGKEHVVIDSVKGTSCQYKRGDRPATKTDAMNEAKYWAKQQGAEGIKNLKCDPPRGRTLFQGCWERITCTGQAIKLAK